MLLITLIKRTSTLPSIILCARLYPVGVLPQSGLRRAGFPADPVSRKLIFPPRPDEPDVPLQCLPRKEALSPAPEAVDGMFGVPRID